MGEAVPQFNFFQRYGRLPKNNGIAHSKKICGVIEIGVFPFFSGILSVSRASDNVNQYIPKYPSRGVY